MVLLHSQRLTCTGLLHCTIVPCPALQIAIALGPTVYLWNASTGSVEELCTAKNEGDYITSVAWAADSTHIAVGTSDAKVQVGRKPLCSGSTSYRQRIALQSLTPAVIVRTSLHMPQQQDSRGTPLWSPMKCQRANKAAINQVTLFRLWLQVWDVARCKQVKELVGHTNRVSALAWNNAILSSGGRDSAVRNWDVRMRKHEACVSTLVNHEQEVCGLRWSQNGMQLASGGNDNMMCIYNASFELQHRINAHQAAVKALAWCPFQSNLLASGGGTADRCIKFWNTTTGAMLNSIDTGSQVCALQWSRHEREILSSHGYSKNQLILWRYPSLVKVGRECCSHGVTHRGPQIT